MNSKVGRVIEQYDLVGLGEELEKRWLGERRTKQSLRELEAHLNQKILESAILESDETLLKEEIEIIYRLLTNEESSRVTRTEVESKLDRWGVDVKEVSGDFVSHQAVHNYLTDVRGVELPPDEKNSTATIEKREEVIQRLRSRLVSVTERSIENLRSSEAVSVGEFDIVVNITIHCSDCVATQDIGEFLREGGCQCQRDGE